MSDDRVTETTTTGAPHTTTIIERRGSGAGLLIGLALLIAVVIGGFYLFNQSRNDAARTDAIAGAASDVGEGARKVGDSVEKAVDDATK